ncbi:hypothetical protein FKW77_010877 [Venturia effusa]|uniref:Mid2 domain-containing protein n=1 Tax=Venturia effusa TaxID=50376 RepID=A0A517KYQ6_9PEZI|nr:hypothetical protein FKW77_010877 [Venturia effusa]
MVSSTYRLCCLLGLFANPILLVSGQGGPRDSNNYFINPPEGGTNVADNPDVFKANPVYTIGEDLEISWVTNFTSGLRLELFRQSSGPLESQTINGKSTPGMAYWIRYSTWIKVSPSSFFMMYDATTTWDENNPKSWYIFTSHYINLTRAVRTSTTSNTMSSTASQTLWATTSGSTPSSSTPASSTSGSSHNAAALGGGIGGGIGGAILLAALAFIAWKHYSQGKPENTTPQQQDMSSGYATWNSAPSKMTLDHDSDAHGMRSLNKPWDLLDLYSEIIYTTARPLNAVM